VAGERGFDRQVAEYAVAGMNTVFRQIRTGLDDLEGRLEQDLPAAEDPVRELYRVARARWTAAVDDMAAHLEGAHSALSATSPIRASIALGATATVRDGDEPVLEAPDP
jgi:hypothetical protein